MSNSAAAAQPVVTITASPTEVQPGLSRSISWLVSNATSCTASGGTGSDGWSGTKPTSGSGASIGPFSAAGSYSYTLNCSGPGGSIGGTAPIVASGLREHTVNYPAGRKVGFLVAQPGQLLSLGVLRHVSVGTYLNGARQEVAGAGDLLEVMALRFFSNPGFVGFRTSKPISAVRLDVGSLVGVSTTMNVYGACVTMQ